MDSRLRPNVEPQLRPEDTSDQMVAVAQHYDATMYRTGAYKSSDRSQASSSKTHTAKKENTYRKLYNIKAQEYRQRQGPCQEEDLFQVQQAK